MIAAQARRTDDASLAASRAFRGLRPEVERAVRTSEPVKDERVEALVDAWCGFECKIKLDEGYSAASSIFRGLTYSARDVESFSVALSRFIRGHPFKAGVFMSALINNCPGNDFILHTRHYEEQFMILGYKNTKDIMVEGDAGNNAGFLMEGGSVTVDGDAGERAGEMMTGGRLLIRGDCGDDLGRAMRGGRIIVEGNPMGSVGDHMMSGEIRLEGGLGKLSGKMLAGMIYHKGVLIWPKGGDGI